MVPDIIFYVTRIVLSCFCSETDGQAKQQCPPLCCCSYMYKVHCVPRTIKLEVVGRRASAIPLTLGAA